MKNNADFSNIKVLVVNIWAYGNVGDHLEIAPLFYKLYEWGVGTVDAHLTQYTIQMGKVYNVPIPAIAGQPYLCEPYTHKIFYEMPENPDYDLIIYAPGPCVWDGGYRDLFTEDHQKKCDSLFFGLTYSKADIEWFEKQLLSGNQSICGIVAREPVSEENIKKLISRLNEQNPALKTPEVIMSEDISFSSSISTDMDYVDICSDKFKSRFVSGYELVFLRASEIEHQQFGIESHVKVSRNKKSGKLEILLANNQKIHELTDNVVITTTDGITDSILMQNSMQQLPEVPHVICETVEELYALVNGASHVYSARYHGVIMATYLNKPITTLPHCEKEKMLGVEMLDKGIREGKYKGNNDRAWRFLYSILREITKKY